jgi:ssDNA-binding Zn-finger/Zn-ribbon topoisomerase 1
MAQCVFCDTTTNLNTSLTITLDDGKKVAVQICDTHAEDATVKIARAAYLEKQNKAEGLIAQLKAMGYSIKEQGSLIVPTLPAVPTPAPPTDQQVEPVTGDGLDGEVIATEILDSRRGMQSIGGSTNHGHVAVHASHDFNGLKDKLPIEARKGRAKMTVFEAREGMPIVIPEIRKDGTGTTRIKITKKEDDIRLQGRFKKMAKDTIERDRTPDFARQGYRNTQSDCPICRGACVIKQSVGGKMQDVDCPKCNGSGVISTY